MAKKLLIPGLIIAVALCLTVVMVKNRPRAEAEDTPPVSILVEVVPVVRENAAISVPSQGNVEARTRTSLVAEVTGQIMDVSPNFVTGGFFRRGEVLLQLDDQNYRAAVSRAESSVASAMSQYEQERGQPD